MPQLPSSAEPLAATPALTGRPYYPALTGLRAVAAYLVFAHHFQPAGSPAWYERLTGQLYVGVGLFFVLSGFVIATRYQAGVHLGSGGWWHRYLGRRVARIYPAFFVLNGLLLWQLYWPLKPATAANSLALIFLSQSLLKGFSTTLLYVGLPQSWTLTVEECFYLTAPLVLAWQARWRPAPLAFAGLLLVLGLSLVAWCSGRPALHGLFGSYQSLLYYFYFGRGLEFMLGVLLARWWGGRPAAALAAGRWRTPTGLALMALAVGLLYWLNSPVVFYQGPGPPALFINNVLFPLGATLLLAGLLTERSTLRRLLATPLLQALGRSSYFFYLFHIGVFSLWWQHRFGWGQHVGWQFLATLALSELGYRLLEEPARRWLTARLLPRRPGGA